MPAIVGFLIALIIAFLQNKKLSFVQKLRLASTGVGDENILTMCLIFLAAGAFSGAVRAAGGVESTVNLGLSILPGNMAVAGLFAIGCFISISMGTSVGTITALAPIAAGISDKTGFPMAICAGAVVCGAMFGDNLSIISDTTIAAVKTQGCDMRDKFRENFKIVLPAAIITLGLFYFLGNTNEYQVNGNLGFSDEDRVENIRRIAEVAKLMNDAGLIVITAFISPYRHDRENAKQIIGDGFREVYVSTSIEECEKRDVKGLYKAAREGKIAQFTGITSPYEIPEHADVVVDTAEMDVETCVNHILEQLKSLLRESV